jgi:hypothetical protein
MTTLPRISDIDPSLEELKHLLQLDFNVGDRLSCIFWRRRKDV